MTQADAASGTVQVQLPQYGAEPAVTVRVSVGPGTVWQAIAGASSLVPGMFIDLDGALQPDGSIGAGRIAVPDPQAVDVMRGPVLFISDAEPVLEMQPRQAQGSDFVRVPGLTTMDLEYGSACYQICGGFSNLSQLPFAPTFDASSIIPGQNVYISSSAFILSGGLPYQAHAMTITLMPQTIDGMIVATTMSGGFTLYTVQLASYDLPVDLAVQQGQSTNVTQPSIVTVYADSATRILTSSALTVGQTARFYGLLFDDNGVLRMDGAQILDGVAQ